MQQYVHHVPGRLRIKQETFKTNPVCVKAIAGHFDDLDDTLKVKHNQLTGSVTIHYDKSKYDPNLVSRTLKDAGCMEDTVPVTLDDKVQGATNEVCMRIGRACLGMVVGRALAGTPLSFLAALI